MRSYEGEMCLIDGQIVKLCVGQDWLAMKIYFPLDADKESFDCGACSAPSFEVDPERVRILTAEEKQNYLLHGQLERPHGAEVTAVLQSVLRKLEKMNSHDWEDTVEDCCIDIRALL